MSELNEEQFDRIVGTIYEAGLDSRKWQGFLDELGNTVDGVRLGLQGFDENIDCPKVIFTRDYSAEFMRSYSEHYSKSNPWIRDSFKYPVGVPIDADLVTPRRILRNTEFYNDWLLPQENISHGITLVIFRSPDRSFRLSTNIRKVDADLIKPILQDVLQKLAPHLQRAFNLNRTLEGAQLINCRYREVLDNIDNPVFLLDRFGRISHPNRAGEQLLRKSKQFYIDSMGTLHLSNKDMDKILCQTVGAIAAGQITELSSELLIHSHTDVEQYIGSIVPFRPDENSTGLPTDFLVTNFPVAMLTIVDPTRKRDPSRHALAMFHKLTPTEIDLAIALFQGKSLQDISEACGVSIHTARNQLKSVFYKTGTSKQGELVALIARLTA